MPRMIKKEWLFSCISCEKTFGIWAWNYELDGQACPVCNEPVDLYIPERGKSAGIATDSIPGGVEIRHLSSKPERFYSRTDIKRACNERGFNWLGDSPKKYPIRWSGRSKDGKPAE